MDEVPPPAAKHVPSAKRKQPPVNVKPLEDANPAANIPPSKVEVPAKVERIPEPVMRRPAEADKVVAAMPPEKVDVARLVLRMLPPVIVSPAEEARPTALTPPEKVEVARLVEVMVPVATMLATLRLPAIKTLPCTANVEEGLVVPMPTMPLDARKSDEVAVSVVPAEA